MLFINRPGVSPNIAFKNSALAQESLSTSSLGHSHHPGRQEGLRGKFSLGRLRSNSSTLDIPNDPAACPPLPAVASPSPRVSYDTTNSSSLDVTGFFVDRHIDKEFHPYASPELVSYSLEPPKVLRKDSNSTIVEVPPFFAKPLTISAPAPETSKRRTSHVHGKDISSPVSVSPDTPSHPQPDESLPHAIPGWTERNLKPGFSLISLEEARAQRRGTTLLSLNTRACEALSSGDSSTTTAPETPPSLSSDASYSESVAARARGRSISAGTKARNVLSSLVRQPERRGSESGFATGLEVSAVKDANAPVITSKNLKHKKSGFMRLFGNAKVNEKEPSLVPLPPSAPSLSQSEASILTSRHYPKPSSHRIPVPSLSPSLLEAASRLEGAYQPGTSDVIDVSWSSTTSPKHPLPHNISVSNGSSPLQTSPLQTSPRAASIKDVSLHQRAPPDVEDFPALKLRPVSTLFSAHFGDHIDVTKLGFADEQESIGPKETGDDTIVRRRENERLRLDSLASMSVSSSSASATSSQYNLSPLAPSFAGTALTTPVTGGTASPTDSGSTAGPTWSRDHDYVLVDERLNMDPQFVPPSLSPNASFSSHAVREKDAQAATAIKVLQEHLDNTNKMWQKRVCELENEVKSLKNELARMKLQKHNEGYEKCGDRLPPVPPLPSKPQQQKPFKNEGGAGRVMNRPRVKTGSSARFVNGQI